MATLHLQLGGKMYWDRFDICEAYYVFAMLWHGGQWSDEYATFGRLARLNFSPSPMLAGPENLSDNGQEIYAQLIERF